MLTDHLQSARYCYKVLNILNHLNDSKYYLYPHFTIKQIGSQRSSRKFVPKQQSGDLNTGSLTPGSSCADYSVAIKKNTKTCVTQMGTCAPQSPQACGKAVPWLFCDQSHTY